MRTKSFSVIAVIALALISAARALAHHAFAAEFDANKPVKLKGTVTKMEWINPHAWIHIDVTGPDGKVEKWMIEGGTPNTLFRRGFTKNSIVYGTVIVVDGYQSKDGSTKANGRDLTFTDGRKLFLGSSGTGAPKDGKDSTEK
jgi:hypothetical protein